MTSLNVEKLLQQAQEKARKIADRIEQGLERRLEADEDADPQELIDFVTTKLRKQGVIPASESSVIELQLTYQDVIQYYLKAGIKPMRSYYWFAEDLRREPLIRSNCLADDRQSGTPFAAICLVKAAEAVTDADKQRAAFVSKEPTYKWYLGPIAQLTEFTCSYIQGFSSGFDGNAPGHPNCSHDFHRGYNDGTTVAKRFLIEQKITEQPDPFENETNPAKLSELYRIGYYCEQEEVDEGQEEANSSTGRVNDDGDRIARGSNGDPN